jgi:hypothetical protein
VEIYKNRYDVDGGHLKVPTQYATSAYQSRYSDTSGLKFWVQSSHLISGHDVGYSLSLIGSLPSGVSVKLTQDSKLQTYTTSHNLFFNNIHYQAQNIHRFIKDDVAYVFSVNGNNVALWQETSYGTYKLLAQYNNGFVVANHVVFEISDRWYIVAEKLLPDMAPI